MYIKVIKDYSDGRIDGGYHGLHVNTDMKNRTRKAIMLRGNSKEKLEHMVDLALSEVYNQALSEVYNQKINVYTDDIKLGEQYNIQYLDKIGMQTLLRKTPDIETLLIITDYDESIHELILNTGNTAALFIDYTNKKDIHESAFEYIADEEHYWVQYGTGENNNFILFQSTEDYIKVRKAPLT